MTLSRIFTLLAAASTFGAATSAAQTFPAKNVRIIVGLAPGGTTDL